MIERLTNPPPDTSKWVTSEDGGYVQILHIVRFVQENVEIQEVTCWLANGTMIKSTDPVFWPAH
jgi:hypothetical protein